MTKIVTIAISAALSDPIDLSKYSGGVILMPSAWTAAGIGFKISKSYGGTYVALIDAAGEEVEAAVAAVVDVAHPMPAAIFGFKYVKVWSETAGADVTQAAERVLTILPAN